MTYFSKKHSTNKTSTPSDEVFYIFQTINTSDDELDISDDIIRAIKQYNGREFIAEDVDMLITVSNMVFKEPIVPNSKSIEKPILPHGHKINKFEKKYPI